MLAPIPTKEAIERLAKAVEKASPDDLAQVYTEFYPEKPLPHVTGDAAKKLATELVARIRGGLEPDEVVDLWHVVFTANGRVYYDEEDDALRHREERPRYAEQ